MLILKSVCALLLLLRFYMSAARTHFFRPQMNLYVRKLLVAHTYMHLSILLLLFCFISLWLIIIIIIIVLKCVIFCTFLVCCRSVSLSLQFRFLYYVRLAVHFAVLLECIVGIRSSHNFNLLPFVRSIEALGACVGVHACANDGICVNNIAYFFCCFCFFCWTSNESKSEYAQK